MKIIGAISICFIGAYIGIKIPQSQITAWWIGAITMFIEIMLIWKK